MANRDIIVIGASAGGVEALSQIVAELPVDLPATIFVVLHISPHGVSVLPQILSRAGKLPAAHPVDGAPIEPGLIYVAPPDHHLLAHRGSVRVVRGPRENGYRPAVDPLFRTASRYYGPRVIGVVLTGALDDGTSGLATVKSGGGIAVVQDPNDSFQPGMPRSAVENVEVDYVLPLSRIASTLVELTQQTVEEGDAAVSEEMEIETDMAELESTALHSDWRPGTPTGFTCPECHGSLFELRQGELLRFRCRVGHAYSADSLLADQSSSLEAALWTALRALEETSALARRVAQRANDRDRGIAAARFEAQAAEAEQSAEVIRQVLLKGNGAAPVGLDSGLNNGAPYGAPEMAPDGELESGTSGHQ